MDSESLTTLIEEHSHENVAVDLVCGGIAGSFGVFMGIPFDIVKVRMQTFPEKFPSALGCFQNLIRNEGFAGVYKGSLAPIAPQGLINAILFASDSLAMKVLQPDLKPGEAGDPLKVLFAGMFGGVCQCSVVVPSETIKCNMQVDTMRAGNGGQGQYRGIVDCVRQIHQAEGIKGLYRGFGATIIREVPSFGIYFSSYKHLRAALTPKGQEPSQATTLFSGGVAGALSWMLCYPIDVIKTRIQISSTSSTITGMARQLYREHGYRIFIRGLGLTILRAFPVNAATFFVYEELRKVLQ